MRGLYGNTVLEEFGSADITFQSDHVDPLAPPPEAEIGLNDDVVFQGEDPKASGYNAYDFFEDPEPGELPVMKEDLVLVAVEEMQLISAIESQVKHLNSVLVAIERDGGMSKSLALEARQVFPEFDNGTHVGYYTEHPSMTRLSIATESISGKMWAIIAAAAAAIAAMIYKLYKWLTGKDDPTPADVVKAAENRVKVIQEVGKAIQDIEEVTHQAEQEAKTEHVQVILEPQTEHTAEKAVPFSTFDSVVEDLLHDKSFAYAKDILHGSNHFINDLLDHGPYTRSYIEVGGMLDVIVEDLEAKIDNSMRIVTKVMKDRRILTEYTHKNMLKELQKELSYNVAGKQRTLRDIAAYMAESRAKAHESYSSRHIAFSQMLRKTRELMHNHDVMRAMATEVSVYSKLDMIRKQSDTLADFLGDPQDQIDPPSSLQDPRANIGPDTGPMMIKAILHLRSEISAYEMILQSAHQFELQMEHTYRACFAIGKKVFGRLSRTISRSGKEVPSHLIRTLHYLSYMNDAFGRTYKLYDPKHWRDKRYLNASWHDIRDAVQKEREQYEKNFNK